MLVRRDSDVRLRPVPNDTELVGWYDSAERTAAPEEPWDPRRYLRALVRYRWIVIGAPVLALATAAVYLRTAVPIYEARAKLLIDAQSPNVVNFQAVVDQSAAKLDYYETQASILRSRTLARATLDRLHLWEHPELAQKPSPGRLSSMLGLAKPSSGAEDPLAVQSRVLDAFADRLVISYRAGNRLFDTGFRSADPMLAASVANTIAQVYIDQNLDLKIRAVKEASDWLNARLVEQRKQVEASELALQRYREENADVSLSEQQNIIVRKLAELSTAATAAKAERIDAEALAAQVDRLRENAEASDALPMILSNPFIQQLKTERASLQRDLASMSERLGERHPERLRVESAIARVDAQLHAEVSKVSESVRNQVAAMRAKEANLAGAVATQERLALALDRRGIQYSALQREVTSNRQIFEALLDRAKQTEISSELKVTNMQIVDPAEVPQTPAAPQPVLVVLFALLVGLPFGVGTAIVLGFFDDRIESVEEMRELGVRVLGLAPAMPKAATRAHKGLLHRGASTAYAEALRSIRTNLCLHVASTARSLLVTSTGPGEGKTLVAANLAIVLAQSGRRVLLIDADLRRCHVHSMFDQPLGPGLSAVLDGKCAAADAIRPSNVAGLSVLTAGSAGMLPGDLLELPTFTEMITALEGRFDWIVIDSPPVMAASDAVVLARTVAAVVFVVGAHMTRASSARAALEQLREAQSNVIGAVLSRCKPSMLGPYYGAYLYTPESRAV